jgi:hypothetical protein
MRSQWQCRKHWPADPYGHVYLLRAVEMIGAAKLGEQWRPPPQLTEETAFGAAEIDRAWIGSEEFLTISRLVADQCAAGALMAVRHDGGEVVAMDATEWLLEYSREGDACFRTGHIFLPNKALPMFVRKRDVDALVATLSAPPEEQPAPKRPDRRRGPAPGATDRFGEADRALFPEMTKLIKQRHLSPGEAARLMSDKIEGRGTSDSRIRRVADRYRKEVKN